MQVDTGLTFLPGTDGETSTQVRPAQGCSMSKRVCSTHIKSQLFVVMWHEQYSYSVQFRYQALTEFDLNSL